MVTKNQLFDYQFLSRKYILAQQRMRQREEEAEADSGNDDEDDEQGETYEEDIDQDVFMDYGKMTRTNSNRRRPSAIPGGSSLNVPAAAAATKV